MLPFMKPKTIAGLIVKQRKPDGSTQEQHSEGNEDSGIDACSEALIRAVHAKDAKAVTAALKDAFSVMESSPEESEESSDNPHTYDAQNAKAAKGQI